MLKLIAFNILLLLCFSSNAQQPFTNPNGIVDTFKKSIPRITKTSLQGSDFEINYYSPAVRNRIIWGGLVPYDQVWVTGAHSATNIKFSKNILLGNSKIKAGKYALFTIPGKEEWTIILNKNYQQHLADNYNQEEDVIRVKAKPIAVETSLERLQYIIENGKLIIAWEKLRVEVPLMIE